MSASKYMAIDEGLSKLIHHVRMHGPDKPFDPSASPAPAPAPVQATDANDAIKAGQDKARAEMAANDADPYRKRMKDRLNTGYVFRASPDTTGGLKMTPSK